MDGKKKERLVSSQVSNVAVLGVDGGGGDGGGW